MKTRFLNDRYVPQQLKEKLKVYTFNNGIFKECLPYRFSKKILGTENLYFDFDALPEELQLKYEDMVININEDLNIFTDKNNVRYVYDKNNIKVRINENTPILPIVGNILPSDDVHAYTIRKKDGIYTLIPIVICIDCHWSDLFSGRTKYGKNVFCLASDLSKDILEEHIAEIITLKDASNFLNENIKRK